MIRRLVQRLALLQLLFIGSLGVFPMAAHAQESITSGLDAAGQTVHLAQGDPRLIAGRIINVALGLIGIVLVSLVIYAGFLYMTSGGNADKINTAKKILRNSIIGLAIILSAWAITSYVINALLNATQNQGGAGGGGGSGGGGLGGGGAGATFRVDSIIPSGNTPIRNVEVAVVFTRAVDPSTASAVVVQEKASGNTVGGTIAVAGNTVTFTPSTPCPAPNADRECFASDTDFTVRVGGTVKSLTGSTVSCSKAGSCAGAFHTGNLVDVKPPTVRLSFPTDGMSVPQDFAQDVLADVTDDAGVKLAQFFEGQNDIGTDAVPNGQPAPLTYNARIAWQTTGAAIGPHSLSALAKDVDTNESRSNTVSVVVRPAHCFNQKQDTNLGETGIDCGGDPQSQDYCGSCLGGACQKNSDCASGVCQNGLCVAKPLIYAVSPLDGKPGTFVTLQGVNFGTSPGTVTFLGNPNDPSDDRVATAPAACTGIRTWTNYQAIVALPAGTATGPIELKNVSSTLSDRTDDDNGPKIKDFAPNNTIYPGVCGIQPESDVVGAQVSMIGAGFGAAPSQVLFGADYTITSFPSWTDGNITFQVPVVDNGPYDVAAVVGTTQSNVVNFTVLEKSLLQPPTLTDISPNTGPQQQYVTLFGTNLGYDVGTVIFTDVLGSNEAVGDTSFPAECSNAFWRNDSVTIKVPSVFKNNTPTPTGSYKVKVIRRDGATTNSLDFKIAAGTPTPGLCAIVPAIGPADALVTLYGEHFGIAKPSVTFAKSALGPVSVYKDQQIGAKVPTNAVTGRVKMTTSDAKDSNTVPFQVKNCNEDASICGPADKFKCCPTGVCVAATAACGANALSSEYGWNASTGLIPISPRVVEECNPNAPKPPGPPTPSPAPWDQRTGGDQAPVDSVITIRFDRPLGDRAQGGNNAVPVPPSTVIPSAFTVSKCTGVGADPCTSQQIVSVSMYFRAENNQQDVVTLEPLSNLDPATTYSVTVASTIKADGPGGGAMEVMKKCGTGKNGETYGYCFKFKTRSSTEPTQVGDVSVYPNPFHMQNIGDITGYEAAPFAADDRCVILNCSKFGWDWYTGTSPSSQDARATITNLSLDGKVLCRQTGTGLQETVQVPVDVNAKVLQTNPIIGTAQLYVNFVPPKVEDYGPNCDQACSNALIWARFTGAMDQQTTTNPDNVAVQKCRNENCNEAELGALIPIKKLTLTQVPGAAGGDVRERFLGITPTGNLESGAFYRVLLKGGPSVPNGMKGKNGVPLTGLNHPQGFTWSFRVKQDVNAFCVPTRIDVSPLEKYEYQVYASQLFLMTPYGPADSCAAGGQMLVTAGNTDWTTSKPEVAALYKSGKIDTGAPLPKGCTNNCLAAGATGRFGLTAVCGNNQVETTDKSYCVVRSAGAPPTTPRGTPCILLQPGAAAGEECEPSRDGLGICDAKTCKFLPVPSVTTGGSCGNGTVEPDKGEMCDFGTFCHYDATVKDADKTVAEGKPCEVASDGATRVACKAAGGLCQPLPFRGCTSACQHAGSQAGLSTCGNSDPLGDGKDCDDGNRTDGDGCSSLCLHEGSAPSTQVASICDNGVLEPGETCEATSPGGPLPQGCDPITCLHTGNVACNRATDWGCCGNGILEYGEDCDDGNTLSHDGCSRVCLFEGSSAAYKDLGGPDVFAPAPSFCSDGVISTGEQCESGRSSDQIAGPSGINYPVRYAAAAVIGADRTVLRKATADMIRSVQGGISKGDGDVDPIQLAYIEGDTSVIQALTGSPLRVLDAQNRISSILGATYATKKGTATYGLQCGFKDEAQCPTGMGLDTNGCCSQRPDPVNRYPTGTDVCRNVLINVTFNVGMDSGSVVNNFQILSPEPPAGCPSSSKEVLLAKDYAPTLLGKVRHAWDALVEWVTGKPALADKWCSGTITGQLRPQVRYAADGKTALPPVYFSFRLDQALAPQTLYRLRFLVDDNLLDNADPAKRVGIKSAAGTVADSSPLWTFTTGNDICRINAVGIVDTTLDPKGEEHPYLYLNKNGPETRSFHATAQALRNGVAVPLSPITNVYDWNWIAWTENSRGTLLTIVPPVNPATAQPDDAAFKAAGGGASGILSALNGNVILGANVKITADTVSIPSTAGRVVQGVKDVTVMTCSNPWPTLSTAPFRDSAADVADSYPLSLWQGDAAAQTLFLGTPNAFFNFSTAYCKDANTATSTDDDLPTLKINPVAPNAIDSAAGIFRQLLFTYGDDHPELKSDGIGMRIIGNPQHLSPAEWYRSRGFTGSPQSVVVDQYPAVKDGTSVYVAAANRPVDGGPIYSNVYLISHNEGAKDITKKIYDQMVAFLAFNINMKNQSNVCVHPTAGDGEPYVDGLGRTIPCTADFECLKFDPSLKCDSLKFKLARDTQRLADFQAMAKLLEAARKVDAQNPAGAYPRLDAGTYLRNVTNSVWPSWQAELGPALKTQAAP